MQRIKQLINKLSYNRKVLLGVISLCLVLMLSILIPTLANFIKENTSLTTTIWDGSIASSYKSGDGSMENPYIISNGAELAYFGSELEDTDYSDTYFTISNNIILNGGSLRYNSETGIEYILNGTTYYIEYYTNKYYDNPERNGTEVGTVNIFPFLNDFAGHINGNLHTIYGLYLTDSSNEELAFFNSLEANIQNLFFKNTLVYGGTTTAGLAVKSDDTVLNNLLFDGFIVGKKQPNPKTVMGSLNADVIEVQNYETTNYINLKNNIPYVGEEIISVKITGNYEVTGSEEETMILINGVLISDGSFEIDLGATIIDRFSVITSTTSTAPVSVNFTSINYEILYNHSITAGLIAEAKNTVVKNTVNAADIFGSFISSGLVGIASGSFEVIQSYNRGLIHSVSLGAGLIGSIQNDQEEIEITRSYNSGNIEAEIKGGLIGIVNPNSANIWINNSFEGTEIKAIALCLENQLTVSNSYTTLSESVNEDFTNLTLEEIKNEIFLIENLEFNKYIDEADLQENPNNIWTFEPEEFPLTYYDKVLTKIVRLQLGTLVFKDYKENLPKQIIKSNITFNLEEVNAYDSIKTKEYFITDSEELTKEDLNETISWTNYESIQQITTEGSYIIYVKVTDYKNRVSYLNSDILILDLSGPEVSLNNGETTWSLFKEEADTVYTNRVEKVTINTDDELSGIAYIKYLISKDSYSEAELSGLDESDWINYNDEIIIDDIGKYIVYVQVIDNAENISYMNTSYFNYQGYVIDNAYVGWVDNPVYHSLPANITYNSAFTLKTKYTEETTETFENIYHNIMTSIILPQNTKIKLIDHFDNKVYAYQIITDDDYGYNDSCQPENINCQNRAKYPFTLFKEKGRAEENYYDEKNYYSEGKYEENFTVIFDFSETNINDNYEDTEVYLEIQDSNNEVVRSTLINSLQKFNLYSTVNEENARANIYLSTDYLDNAINLNTNSITEINLTSGINYKRINEFKIIDTAYEYASLGFEVKLTDINGQTISKEHLRNVAFQVGDKNYSLGEDSIVRIPGNSLNSETNITVKIITHEGDSGLDEGIYYFKISSFKSLGRYVAEDSDLTEIMIPVNVSKSNYNKSYHIDMNLASSIMSKTKENENVVFALSQNSELINPIIRVSLYEKAQLTAYNQQYNLVDLKDYIMDNLEQVENCSYYVSPDSESNFTINFEPAKFNNTGYQLIFEVYDGDKRIDLVKKYFIVK